MFFLSTGRNNVPDCCTLKMWGSSVNILTSRTLWLWSVHFNGSLRGWWKSGDGDEWMRRAANGLWARENSNLSRGHFLSAQSTERSGGASFIFPGWRKSVFVNRILVPQPKALNVKALVRWAFTRPERCVDWFPRLVGFLSHLEMSCIVLQFLRAEANKAISFPLYWNITGVATTVDRCHIPGKGSLDWSLFLYIFFWPKCHVIPLNPALLQHHPPCRLLWVLRA